MKGFGCLSVRAFLEDDKYQIPLLQLCLDFWISRAFIRVCCARVSFGRCSWIYTYALVMLAKDNKYPILKVRFSSW